MGERNKEKLEEGERKRKDKEEVCVDNKKQSLILTITNYNV